MAEHVACAAEKKNVCRVLARGIQKGDHLEDECVDGRMSLIGILSKWAGRAWNGLIWLTIGTRDGVL